MKKSASRKLLIIRGAKQVGKTWLMKEFGRLEYQKCAYVNFESSAVLKTLFVDNFDIRRINHVEVLHRSQAGLCLLR